MSLKEKNVYFLFLFLLVGWLVFIFLNAVKSSHFSFQNTTILTQNDSGSFLATTSAISDLNKNTTLQSFEIQDKLQNVENLQEKLALKEDISILESAYEKTNDIKIAKKLIEKLAKNYEFEKANLFLKKIMTTIEHHQNLSLNDVVDPHLHLYLIIHDPQIISITDPHSIKNIESFLENYKQLGVITDQDYYFYQALIQLRYKNYKGAWDKFNLVTDNRYKKIIQEITQAISSYDSLKAIPRYYQDALVALSLLKNGYFSLAKKLALEVVLKDDKYILPYQILAYTHFLTNNRETANEYFLKLMDIDNNNKYLYQFLIGLAFYWSQEYKKSVLYLSQVNDENLLTDTYRYLILNYKILEDKKNMLEIQRRLLGQKDITGSDYYDYFYETFFKPYSINVQSLLYQEDPLLAEMYVDHCFSTFTGKSIDVCKYGKIGLHTLKKEILPSEIPEIIQLANTYQKSYLFSILGDIYQQLQNFQEAKNAYIKALSLSNNFQEQDILRNKIFQLNK